MQEADLARALADQHAELPLGDVDKPSRLSGGPRCIQGEVPWIAKRVDDVRADRLFGHGLDVAAPLVCQRNVGQDLTDVVRVQCGGLRGDAGRRPTPGGMFTQQMVNGARVHLEPPGRQRSPGQAHTGEQEKEERNPGQLAKVPDAGQFLHERLGLRAALHRSGAEPVSDQLPLVARRERGQRGVLPHSRRLQS